MNIVTFDVETTTSLKPSGNWTPSPFFGSRLVSLGYKYIDRVNVDYLCFYHEKQPATPKAFVEFRDVLDECDLLIGHNIKFDLMWLRECGWQYNGAIYDTMVAEYVLAGSRRWPLNLESVAEKYAVQQKKADLVKKYLDDGITFDKIPYDIVEEYGKADVLATEQIAIKQAEAYGTTLERIYK
jgi:DNA polymerase I-like protein with 3'-5' exonuclease and polymerase domains